MGGSASSELNPPEFAHEIFGDRINLAVHFAELLADTGVTHGLIGPREVPRIWQRHILNCAVIERCIAQGAVVGDIGSGAGLPGVALAIARPDLHLHLIEPMARRITWLHTCQQALGLTNVTVHHGRAESFAGALQVNVVTARAVARLGPLCTWASPLMLPDGELLALKGASAAQEVLDDAAEVSATGGQNPRVEIIAAEGLDVPSTVVRVSFPHPIASTSPTEKPRRAASYGRAAKSRQGRGAPRSTERDRRR